MRDCATRHKKKKHFSDIDRTLRLFTFAHVNLITPWLEQLLSVWPWSRNYLRVTVSSHKTLSLYGARECFIVFGRTMKTNLRVSFERELHVNFSVVAVVIVVVVVSVVMMSSRYGKGVTSCQEVDGYRRNVIRRGSLWKGVGKRATKLFFLFINGIFSGENIIRYAALTLTIELPEKLYQFSVVS